VWELANHTCLYTYAIHTPGLNVSVAFGLNGKTIMTVSDRLFFWDIATGAPLASLLTWPDGGWLVLDPAGKVMASNALGLKNMAFVHNGCAYPGTEFVGCFPEQPPAGLW
jgi:hypothetical protein